MEGVDLQELIQLKFDIVQTTTAYDDAFGVITILLHGPVHGLKHTL